MRAYYEGQSKWAKKRQIRKAVISLIGLNPCNYLGTKERTHMSRNKSRVGSKVRKYIKMRVCVQHIVRISQKKSMHQNEGCMYRSGISN